MVPRGNVCQLPLSTTSCPAPQLSRSPAVPLPSCPAPQLPSSYVPGLVITPASTVTPVRLIAWKYSWFPVTSISMK